jgi:hypothetical protein
MSNTETHHVSLFVQVSDSKALHAHAMEQAMDKDGGGMSDVDAQEMLGTADEPNISACLRFTFDPGQSPPGTSILDSTCEGSAQ